MSNTDATERSKATKTENRPSDTMGEKPSSAVDTSHLHGQPTAAGLQSPRGTQKSGSAQVAPPMDSSVTMQNLRGKIDSVDLSTNRREALTTAFGRLQDAFENAKPREQTPVYVMEGATGIAKGDGRASTDPDENMALKSIAFVAGQLNEAAVIAVPDAGNLKHTIAYLREMGAPVAELKAGDKMRSGTIYVTRMDDKAAMQDTVKLTGKGRDVMVLGPPLGHAIELLDDKASVTIMGAAKKGELVDKKTNEPIIDQKTGKPKIGLVESSTNTRDPGSLEFMLKAVDMKGTTQYSSKAMDGLTVSLAELGQGTDLVTEADKRHWAKNTREQFLGVAPPPLLTKRMVNAGAESLFEGKPLNLDKLPQLAFTQLFEQTKDAKPVAGALSEAVEKLGPGYEYMLQSGAGAKAKEALQELISAHLDDAKYKDKGGFDAANTALNGMSDQQAVHILAALSLGFQNIYNEKTTDGWGNKATQGRQWSADSFSDAYVARPGKQVPYDAAVVMQPFIGIGSSKEQKAADADVLQLVLWS